MKKYEIKKTQHFNKWLSKLKSNTAKEAILSRIMRVRNGNLGNYKFIKEEIYELKLFIESGYRIYFLLQEEQIIILLCGGDKSSQSRDIKKAIEIKNEIMENKEDDE